MVVTDQCALLPGAWTWFNDPRAVIINGQLYAGAVSPQGDIHIGGRLATPVVLHKSFGLDDHNNPALLRRSLDGRIIACYSRHGADNNYYQRISVASDDLSSFGPERNIGYLLGGIAYTYANLVEIEDGIFNFTRCISDDGRFTPHFTVSKDGGETWSPVQKLLFESGQRPYFKLAKTGPNRIDLICTDGHPGEVIGGNSVYHCYYSDGAWHQSDGAQLELLPFTPRDVLTRVHDGGSNPGAWVWDVMVGPIAVFATFPGPPIDHRYHFARWVGTKWVTSEICAAGRTVYPVGDDTEPYYSGGICIDPDDLNTIYCSRETHDPRCGDRGTFQLWKGQTRDDGATWEMEQITFGNEDCIRPFKPPSSNQLLFVRGSYRAYTNYSTVVAALTL
jgi:hypothetical protein